MKIIHHLNPFASNKYKFYYVVVEYVHYEGYKRPHAVFTDKILAYNYVRMRNNFEDYIVAVPVNKPSSESDYVFDEDSFVIYAEGEFVEEE